MNPRLAKILNVALLSCVAALGLSRTAEAAYVVVKADPEFGAAFPNLGWRATGALYVPDTCAYASIGLSFFGGPYSVNLSSGALAPWCAGAQLQDVKLYFYDTTDPSRNIELLKIGDYDADEGDPAQSDDQTQELIDFAFDSWPWDAAVVEFHTTLSNRFRAMDPLAGNGDYDFALEFSSDNARLVAFNRQTGESVESPNRANVTISRLAGLIPGEQDEYEGTPDEPVFPTQVVPEPASLALALTALAAAVGIGHAGRRRSRRA